MAFLGNFFSKKQFDAAVFEQELDFLSEQINDSRTRTLKLEVSAKRTRNAILKYLLNAYVVVLAYCYYDTPNWRPDAGRFRNFWVNQSTTKLSVIVAFPLVLLLVLYVVERFYKALQKRQRTRYVALKKQKNAKIDQLKKETHFNSTNEILSKYGEPKKPSSGPSAAGPQAPKGPNGPKGPKGPSQQRQQQGPQGPQPPFGPPGAAPQTGPQGQPQRQFGPAGGPGPAFPGPPAPSGGKRTYQDRILDLIIGSENNESLEDRFALICANCYHHNGLAPPGCKNPQKVVYVCPHCGFLNGEPDQKHETTAAEAPPGDKAAAEPQVVPAAAVVPAAVADDEAEESALDESHESAPESPSASPQSSEEPAVQETTQI